MGALSRVLYILLWLNSTPIAPELPKSTSAVIAANCTGLVASVNTMWQEAAAQLGFLLLRQAGMRHSHSRGGIQASPRPGQNLRPGRSQGSQPRRLLTPGQPSSPISLKPYLLFKTLMLSAWAL